MPRRSESRADRQTRISAARVHNGRVEAVLFIGVQGSGKSTFYPERFFATHVRINLDMLRTRQRAQILLNACIEAKQSFVIDNTNALATDRARYIPFARAAGFRVVAYFFETTLADAMRRNNQQLRKTEDSRACLGCHFSQIAAAAVGRGLRRDLYHHVIERKYFPRAEPEPYSALRRIRITPAKSPMRCGAALWREQFAHRPHPSFIK